MFNLVLRPNPVLAPRSVYEAKAARWQEEWPELTVLDWPSAGITATSDLDRVRDRIPGDRLSDHR